MLQQTKVTKHLDNLAFNHVNLGFICIFIKKFKNCKS